MNLRNNTKQKTKLMNSICPKSEKCPIFKGGILKRAESEQVYRNLYCNAGEKMFAKCKRYIISERLGVAAPVDILPNCSKDIEVIIEEIKLTK